MNEVAAKPLRNFAFYTLHFTFRNENAREEPDGENECQFAHASLAPPALGCGISGCDFLK